jgi:hypothetical protein
MGQELPHRFIRNAHDGPYSSDGDTYSPEGFSEPVTDLRRTALDIAPYYEPDAAGGFATDFYCEVRLRSLTLNDCDPLLSIRVGVGVWEAISQSPPNLVVVGMTNQRGLIAPPPRSKDTATAVEPHARISAVPVIVIWSAPKRLSRLHDARWFVSTARRCQRPTGNEKRAGV